mmetsp:Transcript_58350/g.117208  ORF Transcript_58350/g.117208 Transcript_58350/m.117208 type:complete len:286 (-) Transcript_58350:57-914(-)
MGCYNAGLRTCLLLTLLLASSGSFAVYSCNRTSFHNLPGLGSPCRPIQYVHIAKTGGTAVQAYLRQAASEHHVHTQYRDGSFRGKKGWDMEACLVFGHRPIGWAPGFDLRRPLYVVTLREPISFAVSLFDFINRNAFRVHDKQRASFGNSSFSDNVVAHNQVVLNYVRDTQGELLEGVGGCGFVEKSLCVLAHLETAHAVVIAERLDDMLIQLRWKTGWLGVGVDAFPRLNDAHSKSHVTPSARRILEEAARHGVDTPLYRRALELHESLTNEARYCLYSTPLKL